ncbi:unnamed protein product [Linum tenue]|uniref:Uncharacterized protein n=1 Tax=Linum tenue TaxID=586396 RepID=A0AAV0KA76_9ROSI|nr:unnamed protein product [Linum tenue]
MDPDACDRVIVHHQLKAMSEGSEEEEESEEEESSEGSEEEGESEGESSEGLEEEAESEQETIKPKIYLGPPEGFDSYPENKYGKRSCQRCQKLREREFKPKDDDCNYLYDKDDFEGDEELKLRVIHHRKKKWITGGFYADCQPAYTRYGGIYHQEHHWEVLNLDEMIRSSVRFVIKQYKKLKGHGLILKDILNTTMERYACWWFYVTFTGCEQSSSDEVRIYQTLVAYFFRGGEHEVAILRRKIIGQDEYVDLLPPSDELTEERTRLKKELMSTLDEEDRQVFELEEKIKGGEVNALMKRKKEPKATGVAPLSLD